jgi:hypothetical protein
MRKDSRIKVNKEERCVESPMKQRRKDIAMPPDVDEETQNMMCKCKKTPTEELWQIQCNICEKWYHGKCHMISEKMAKHIDRYRCIHCIVKTNDADETEGEEEDEEVDEDVIRERLLRAEMKEKDELLKKKDLIIYGLEKDIKILKQEASKVPHNEMKKDELLNKKDVIISGLENEIMILKQEAKKLREERESAEEALENGKEASKKLFQQIVTEKEKLQKTIDLLTNGQKDETASQNIELNGYGSCGAEIEIDTWTSQEEQNIEKLLQESTTEAISTKTKDDDEAVPKEDENQLKGKNKKEKKKDEQALIKENKNLKNRVKKLEEETCEKEEKMNELNREIDHYYIEVKLLRETKQALKKANDLLEKQAKSDEENKKKQKPGNKRGSKKQKIKPICKYYKERGCRYGEECRYRHEDEDANIDVDPVNKSIHSTHPAEAMLTNATENRDRNIQSLHLHRHQFQNVSPDRFPNSNSDPLPHNISDPPPHNTPERTQTEIGVETKNANSSGREDVDMK